MGTTGEIFKKIPEVMADIGAIGKSRNNPQQGYKFRGIDEVYNAVNAALSKHGIFCAPTVLSMSREERQSQKGATLLYTILNIKYTFYASDGSFFECVTVGEAMDSGDKSCNKAMSAAQKYAFFQVFSIPTEEHKDTELETHEVKKAGSGSQKQEAPASSPGSPAPSPTDDIPNPKDVLIGRMSEFKNSFEAKNWKTKHQATIDFLPAADKGEVMKIYFDILKELNNKGAA